MKKSKKKTNYKELTILTGRQFRQYVHISVRKMKYLMDYDIVPHNDTGKATHRYEIKKADADEYLWKVKHDKEFLAEARGLFSTRKKAVNPPAPPVKPRKLEITKEDATEYFQKLWKDQQDILNAQIAGELIGSNRQYIRRMSENGDLQTCLIRDKITFTKEEFISFVCRKDHLLFPPTMVLKDILQEIGQTNT